MTRTPSSLPTPLLSLFIIPILLWMDHYPHERQEILVCSKVNGDRPFVIKTGKFRLYFWKADSTQALQCAARGAQKHISSAFARYLCKQTKMLSAISVSENNLFRLYYFASHEYNIDYRFVI